MIEEDCWLGTGAIILPGVHIGRGSIIGAGAVVTKDIPPLSLAVGIPARVVRQITP
jgi:acetyltransferase-like isoleucine patch superfamily enzyme